MSSNLTATISEKQVKSFPDNHFSHLFNQMGNDLRLGKLRRKAYRKIFSYIAFLSNVYELVEVSQSKVADRTGYTRQTVNEAFDYFDEQKYIKKVNRHRKTCIYILDPVFYEDLVREKFGHIFRGLKIKSKKIALSLVHSLRLRAKEYYEKLSQLKQKTKITLHQLISPSSSGYINNQPPRYVYTLLDKTGREPVGKQEACDFGTKLIKTGGVGYVKIEEKSEEMSVKYSWQEPVRVDHGLGVEENKQRWYGFEAECKESYVKNRGINEFLILKRDFMIEVCKIKRT